ncbi:helix-turn-helix transcriptional regulator [Novosphingobium profundi]|nr:helix-turn-helix transcriptional regulator [Novosphingobium profundi]
MGAAGHDKCWIYDDIFRDLTDKQREVLGLIANNFTSKEIAYELGISESAVNQRIEAVRGRTGSPPRAELARAYRRFLGEEVQANAESPPEDIGLAMVAPVAAPAVVPICSPDPRSPSVSRGGVDGQGRDVAEAPSVVPGIFEGRNGGWNRSAAIVVIAAGILLVAGAGLSVVHYLAELL